MKTLFIVRHAEAAPKDKVADFERSLVEKGVKESKRISKRFAQHYKTPDIMLSSPANRAIETARVFAEKFTFPLQSIVRHDTLYAGSELTTYMDIIRGLDNEKQTAMIFGHDPMLSTLAATLGESFSQQLPKTSVVGFEFPVDAWSAIAARSGHLVYFDYPMDKELKSRLEKIARKDVSVMIVGALRDIVSQLDPDAANKMKKTFISAGKEITDKLFKTGETRNLLQFHMVRSNGDLSHLKPKKRKSVPKEKKKETVA